MACVVDTSGLTKAINERLRYPGRTEAQALNHAAYSVAHKAMIYTPFTTQEKIDTQLGVAVNLTLTKRGKFSRDQRKKTFTAGKTGDSQQNTTLAKLIILARANLLGKGQSNYNKITNNRWRIDPEMLKGGKAVIEGFIARMIKKRHSSTKFLLSGWAEAKKALAPFVVKRLASPVKQTSDGLGFATPAREGGLTCEAMIENAVGMQGVNGENYNRALILHGQPALQQAIDEESADLIIYAAKLQKEQNDKMNAMMR